MIDFYNPTHIYFTSYENIGILIRKYGFSKVVLLCGSSYLKSSGILDNILNKLKEANIISYVYSGIIANPDLKNVEEALNLTKEVKPDLLLAVGGGSVLDLSKSVANNFYYDGDILDFNKKKTMPTKALPLATIITIAASGSEMSSSCVISDRKTNFKGGFNSPTNYPLFSILDASLTKSVSEFQTCCGLVDIISHSFERYFCKSEEYQVCDLFALGVIRNIVDLTPKLLMNLNDEDLRKAMMETGSVSHNGFTSFGKLTSMPCHFVEHLISGKYPEIAHGLGLSWLLGPFMRRNYEVLKDKIKKFGHFVFDEDDPKVALDKFDEYINSLPFNKTMEDFGITSTEKEYYLSLLKPAL